MREILFRGKRDDGEWVEGYFVHCKSIYDDETGRTAEIIPHNADRIYDGEYCPYDVHKVILKTVGQFTGLTDKNGKKVFEGDIVKHYCEHREDGIISIGVVFWNENRCMFLRTSTAENETPQIWVGCEYEVIGNIHDNPELLEVNQ